MDYGIRLEDTRLYGKRADGKMDDEEKSGEKSLVMRKIQRKEEKE